MKTKALSVKSEIVPSEAEAAALKLRSRNEIDRRMKEAGCLRMEINSWDFRIVIEYAADNEGVMDRCVAVLEELVARDGDTPISRVPVGSTVRCLKMGLNNGSVGKVRAYDPTADRYFTVRWDGDKYDHYYIEGDLELVA